MSLSTSVTKLYNQDTYYPKKKRRGSITIFESEKKNSILEILTVSLKREHMTWGRQPFLKSLEDGCKQLFTQYNTLNNESVRIDTLCRKLTQNNFRAMME